jgi:hypothetical protein
MAAISLFLSSAIHSTSILTLCLLARFGSCFSDQLPTVPTSALDLIICPASRTAIERAPIARSYLKKFASLTGLTIFDLSTGSLLKFSDLFPKLTRITLINPRLGMLAAADFENAAAAICRPGVEVNFRLRPNHVASVEREGFDREPGRYVHCRALLKQEIRRSRWISAIRGFHVVICRLIDRMF